MYKFLNLRNILLLAFCLRAIWALLIPVIPISDSNAYDIFATNIWLHGTYGWEPDKPYSYWPVGTSALYSVFYMVFGHVYWPIVIFHIAISLGIIWFSARLCQLVFQSEKITLLSSFALAVWPTGIFYVTILGSELPYLFCSLAGIS